ncbi:Alpha/Beta hydrolase protein [Crepidotus variabilis]|uniref:Alpha/Beta hydrolase protein n=1 Tax=Crepidotus variabilis TaxID=179855 RepID=A0A9P6JJY1_9AGAR|nr:Alpha/Beta hydrolase protein [Crepidotus variabilis]
MPFSQNIRGTLILHACQANASCLRMSLCQDCFSPGVTHKGTPQGKWEKIGGVDCYVGTPTADISKDAVVLYFADLFGPQAVNAQLMVDDFASSGFKTIAMDYFGGDPAPPDGLDEGTKFDLWGWLGRHSPNVTRPYIDKVVSALATQGVTTLYGTGYCFGGRYVFDLAFDNVLKVAVVAHPSLLEIPKDLETYIAKSQAPLLINSCEIDPVFHLEAQAKADEVLGSGNFKPGYKRNYFPGCSHGFAVRGDMSNPEVKAGKEGAFKATIEWFSKK